MIDQTVKQIKLFKIGYMDEELLFPDNDTVYHTIAINTLEELNTLADTMIQSIQDTTTPCFMEINFKYSDQWTIESYRLYYKELKKIADYMIQNHLMDQVYIKQLDIEHFKMNEKQDTSMSLFKCVYCPIAEGCEGATKPIEDTKYLEFVCSTHIVESLAYSYLYNQYVEQESLIKPKLYACIRLLLTCPYDWAIRFIDQEEYDILYKLAHMDKLVM